MAHHAQLLLGQAVRQHPALDFFLGFLVPVLTAYWFFSVLPYRRGRPEALTSPWRGAQPAVPGVLERHALWEWAIDSRLTSFGLWVKEQAERKRVSMARVAQAAGIEESELLRLLCREVARPQDYQAAAAVALVFGAGRAELEQWLAAPPDRPVEVERH